MFANGLYLTQGKINFLFMSEIVLQLRARSPLKLISYPYTEMGEGGMNRDVIFLDNAFQRKGS